MKLSASSFVVSATIFLTAVPAFAGSTPPIYMPNLQFAEEIERPTRDVSKQTSECTQLEKALKVDAADCGVKSKEELAKLKAARED